MLEAAALLSRWFIEASVDVAALSGWQVYLPDTALYSSCDGKPGTFKSGGLIEHIRALCGVSLSLSPEIHKHLQTVSRKWFDAKDEQREAVYVAV